MAARTIEFKWIYNIVRVFTILMSFVFAISVYIHSGENLPWNSREKFAMSAIVINSTCSGTIFPAVENSENNWGTADLEKTTYVISAYYVREREKIFIIGTKPVYNISSICQLWFTSPDKKTKLMRQTQADIAAPAGNTGYKYISTIFTCRVDSTIIPTHVSLVFNSCNNPQNVLRIRDASLPAKYGRRFTVCLSPMYHFNDAFRLVEWMELNRILGADKFLLYNYSIGVNVQNVINFYVKSGLAEVIQWKTPFKAYGVVENRAQKAVLNDCLFRNKNVSEFIVNIDTDEFIIPQATDVVNWSQMISKFGRNYAGYLFRNSFYRTDWNTQYEYIKERHLVEELKLVTLTYFEREREIWPVTLRSKYFVRTAYVDFANVHEVPRGRMLTVPTETALLHHYKSVKKSKPRKRVKDFTILLKYREILIKNVQYVWNKVT